MSNLIPSYRSDSEKRVTKDKNIKSDIAQKVPKWQDLKSKIKIYYNSTKSDKNFNSTKFITKIPVYYNKNFFIINKFEFLM